MDLTQQELDALLTAYFKSWRPYHLIIKRFEHVHGLKRSVSWLKQQYKRLGLRRRTCDPPDDQLRAIIKEMLNSSDKLRGYRAVWKILRDCYGIHARRDKVMEVMREVDPSGVVARKKRRLKRRVYRSKGPNNVWHVDGYDKLKPYGITIHGCIDGFSRKILWMNVAPSNNDPKIIARYFLECVEKVGGCPSVLRCDYGTENVNLAAIQIAFRMNHEDYWAAEKSFIYGPSTANIRIESWWSKLRYFKTDWWIQLCKDLITEGHFNTKNQIHRWTLTAIFAPLLQNEIDDFVNQWNTHVMRKNRLAECPAGIPDDLYEMPQVYGSEDCLKQCSAEVWARSMVEESVSPPPFCPDWFNDIISLLLSEVWGLTLECIKANNCKCIYIRIVNILEHIFV